MLCVFLGRMKTRLETWNFSFVSFCDSRCYRNVSDIEVWLAALRPAQIVQHSISVELITTEGSDQTKLHVLVFY